MSIRTTRELATIIAIRQDAAEQNAKNGHALPLSALSPESASNWQARIHIALRELGCDRDRREVKLAFLSEVLGREINSTKEMTWPEAQNVCAAIYIDVMKDDLRRIYGDYKAVL